jgi:putative membrane protein insertion efficiency factor
VATPGSPRSRNLAERITAAIVLHLIRAYQLVLSPWLGGHCRYVPTCSQYAREAVERFGSVHGTWLTLRRIGRCRPGGGSGYDPVPEPREIEPEKETHEH